MDHRTADARRRGTRVIVIGGGFGGLSAAHALRKHGIEDVTILERGDAVGGVWRDNTYPGAACDVPSPLYSWSWALNPGWTRRYSGQAEILRYIESTAEQSGLVDLVRTGEDVTSAHFDGAARTWRVRTTGGATYDADVVVSAVGQLSRPVIPRLPGVETFAGPAFHSAQWRHDVDLTGRRVAVVGTGASAIQLVPAIVDRVGSMSVFQRSAPYVVPKPDSEYRPLHSAAFRRFPRLMDAERRLVFALTEMYNRGLGGRSRVSAPLLRLLRLTWRLHLRRQVRDPALRRKLEPDHPLGCKRLLFSNDWYPALDRDHVEVVDHAVVGVEPTGVRTSDGRLHEADVLIWGTGFAATEFLGGIEVVGTEGADLHEVWRDGARAHLGITVPGFPNLFCVYGPNTNLGGSSIIGMLEAQSAWIAEVVGRMTATNLATVEVRRDVADRFDREMQGRLSDSVWAGCDSWYRDGRRITTNWPGLVAEYQERLATVDWSDLVTTPVSSPTGATSG